MHKTSKRSFVTYFSVISVLFNTESTPGTSSISWETLLQLQRTVSRIWTSFLEVSYNVVTQKSRCPSTTLKLFFYYIFFFIKDENHKTCWFLEEKKSSYVWRCFCILWDCWCFLKCTIFFFELMLATYTWSWSIHLLLVALVLRYERNFISLLRF